VTDTCRKKKKAQHHLIPVAEKEENNSRRIAIHRICHMKIHSVFTEEELALKYNTVEKIERE